MNEAEQYLRNRLETAVAACAWKPGRPEDFEAWQAATRKEVARTLGLHRLAAPPLDPVWGESVEKDGVRRTPVEFTTRGEYRAFGYWLESTESEDASPAILCHPGHGAGIDALVGLAEEPYQADSALQCARRGYVVLALEPMGFGHRRSGRNAAQGSSCEADARAALMLGETLAGWRIWDAMRAIDLLQSLPQVDPRRIGTMGISGGGMLALWLAAIDERVRAAVVSGYFCTFRGSILSVDHCLDNFVPGILDVVDMPDLAGLIAPRALFVESGTDDPIFPVKGYRAAVARAKEIYASVGATDQFGFEEFAGGHEFRGERAFEFVEGRL